MVPLCVFLCDDQYSYDNIFRNTLDAVYHRFFILSSNNIIRNRIAEKNTDNFMIYNYELTKIDIISRLVTCYSNPMYSHIFIMLSQNSDFELQKNNFKESNYFQNENCIGFTRQWVALNGFIFEPVQNNSTLDPIEFAQEMSKALNELPVGNKYFIEALIELLPHCEYDLSNLNNFDSELISIVKNKNINSSSKYKVFYEPINFEKTNCVVFSHNEIDSYKFLIKREDGLKCYIF